MGAVTYGCGGGVNTLQSKTAASKVKASAVKRDATADPQFYTSPDAVPGTYIVSFTDAAAAAPAPAASSSAPPATGTATSRAGPAATEASEAVSTTAAPGPPAAWHPAAGDPTRRPLSRGGDGRGPTHGYVRNVTDKISQDGLREALQQFGHLASLEISRAKFSAFIEYRSAADLHAAMAAGPMRVDGESIWVDERRFRPSFGYGGPGTNGHRGGMPRSRGSFDARIPYTGRGGPPKDGGRGNYNPPRGRGGNMAPPRGGGGGGGGGGGRGGGTAAA
ncbi:MAG: hypothetical protein M1826_005052 [Phylliscum demangeonii]|nr:MAG: hypothetical protein M1826_005052 [Phylliscum demangeonii]